MIEKPIYEVTESGTILRTDADGKVWSIPAVAGNSDYELYLRHINGEEETGTIS